MLSNAVIADSEPVLTLLGASEQGSIFLEAEVDFNQVGTGQELHDHSTGYIFNLISRLFQMNCKS